MSVTKRNGLDRWCEFITTFDSDENRTSSAYRYGRSLPTHHTNRIRIDAYDYPAPQEGQLVNAKLRVLPGISPLRLALLHSNTVDAHALAEDGILFPLSHILFDPYQQEDQVSTEADECLQALSEQCAELPENVQKSLRFTIEEQSVALSMGLRRGVVLVVRYGREIPLRMEAVSLKDKINGTECDLRQAIRRIGRRPTLGTLYEFAASSHAQSDVNRSGETDTRSCPLT
jgi:hypothetical protein